MIPEYANTVTKLLHKQLFSITKLHQYHKIMLTSWANYERDDDYIQDVNTHYICLSMRHFKYIVSPINACMYDYGFRQGQRPNQLVKISNLLSYLVLGYFDSAYDFLNVDMMGPVKPLNIPNMTCAHWSLINRISWWKNQKKNYKILKDANV